MLQKRRPVWHLPTASRPADEGYRDPAGRVCVGAVAERAALAGAGYFAAAPNQRGYAPGARPDPAEHANYIIDALIDDAMAIVAGLGHGERRFHLAGHDWGGSLSWDIADRPPGSVPVRPHP